MIDEIGRRMAPADYSSRSSRPSRRQCPCGCGTVGLCAEHKALLARIREDMKARTQRQPRVSRSGKYQFHRGDGTGRGSTCCNPDCWNSRLPGERYCESCQAEGWNEGGGE